MQSSVHYTKRAKNILHISDHSESHETSFCCLNGMSVNATQYNKRIDTVRFDAAAQSNQTKCHRDTLSLLGFFFCSIKIITTMLTFPLAFSNWTFWFSCVNAICWKAAASWIDSNKNKRMYAHYDGLHELFISSSEFRWKFLHFDYENRLDNSWRFGLFPWNAIYVGVTYGLVWYCLTAEPPFVYDLIQSIFRAYSDMDHRFFSHSHSTPHSVHVCVRVYKTRKSSQYTGRKNTLIRYRTAAAAVAAAVKKNFPFQRCKRHIFRQ